MALGYLSCIIPVLCLAVTILVSRNVCGIFGVALSALGMLGTMNMAFTIDAYGLISDNAGGIAEMAGLPEQVRNITECLDDAGSTTAARWPCGRLGPSARGRAAVGWPWHRQHRGG